MKEKLIGMWRQTNHVAIINEMPCDITPTEEIIWEFADGLLMQYANNEILSAHRATFYSDHNIIVIHPGLSGHGSLFVVRFTADGITVIANNQSKDQITLTRA